MFLILPCTLSSPHIRRINQSPISKYLISTWALLVRTSFQRFDVEELMHKDVQEGLTNVEN